MNGVSIRPERPDDASVIRSLIEQAFADAPHASGAEAGIVEKLRASGDLSVSLVAEQGDLIGHVAFSPVSIVESGSGWFGLGPVAVLPNRQQQGVGAALIRQSLARLEASAAAGCVVLGDPAYYSRFGFRHRAELVYPHAPAEYFMALSFGNAAARGMVRYAPAFG